MHRLQRMPLAPRLAPREISLAALMFEPQEAAPGPNASPVSELTRSSHRPAPADNSPAPRLPGQAMTRLHAGRALTARAADKATKLACRRRPVPCRTRPMVRVLRFPPIRPMNCPLMGIAGVTCRHIYAVTRIPLNDGRDRQFSFDALTGVPLPITRGVATVSAVRVPAHRLFGSGRGPMDGQPSSQLLMRGKAPRLAGHSSGFSPSHGGMPEGCRARLRSLTAWPAPVGEQQHQPRRRRVRGSAGHRRGSGRSGPRRRRGRAGGRPGRGWRRAGRRSRAIR